MKPTLNQIVPGPTDRATFYGQTGSGKTTLVRYLLSLRRDVPIFVFDWKGLIKWPGFKRYSTLRAFVTARNPRSIYAPGIHELTNPDFHEGFFHFCYRSGTPQGKGCIVYVDEVSAIAKDDDSIPFWYKGCITRGREKNISVFSSTQRPKKIPQIVLSESEHHYTFALQMRGDRQKIEDTTGILEEKQEQLVSVEHKFIYSNVTGRTLGPTRLAIRKG
jgi:hypothetical protein